MFCPNCGRSIDGSPKFCGYCGQSLPQMPVYSGGGGGGAAPSDPAAGKKPLWVVKFTEGVVRLIIAFFAFGAMINEWDSYRLYMEFYGDAAETMVVVVVLIPVLLCLDGLSRLLLGYAGLSGSKNPLLVGKKGLKPIKTQQLLMTGIKTFACTAIVKFFVVFYDFDWDNSVWIHSLWRALNIYNSVLTGLLVFSVLYIIAALVAGSMCKLRQAR